MVCVWLDRCSFDIMLLRCVLIVFFVMLSVVVMCVLLLFLVR